MSQLWRLGRVAVPVAAVGVGGFAWWRRSSVVVDKSPPEAAPVTPDEPGETRKDVLPAADADGFRVVTTDWARQFKGNAGIVMAAAPKASLLLLPPRGASADAVTALRARVSRAAGCGKPLTLPTFTEPADLACFVAATDDAEVLNEMKGLLVGRSNPQLLFTHLPERMPVQYSLPIDEAGNPTDAAVTAFIDDIKAGKREPSAASEPVIPGERDKYLPELLKIVNGSFGDLVTNNDMDVLVEVYMPDCPACMSWSWRLAMLSELLKDVPTIRIGKMDTTLNTEPFPAMSGYPDLKFFPKGAKSLPIELEFRGMTMPKLLEFVAANAGNKFVVTEVMKAKAEAMETEYERLSVELHRSNRLMGLLLAAFNAPDTTDLIQANMSLLNPAVDAAQSALKCARFGSADKVHAALDAFEATLRSTGIDNAVLGVGKGPWISAEKPLLDALAVAKSSAKPTVVVVHGGGSAVSFMKNTLAALREQAKAHGDAVDFVSVDCHPMTNACDAAGLTSGYPSVNVYRGGSAAAVVFMDNAPEVIAAIQAAVAPTTPDTSPRAMTEPPVVPSASASASETVESFEATMEKYRVLAVNFKSDGGSNPPALAAALSALEAQHSKVGFVEIDCSATPEGCTAIYLPGEKPPAVQFYVDKSVVASVRSDAVDIVRAVGDVALAHAVKDDAEADSDSTAEHS